MKPERNDSTGRRGGKSPAACMGEMRIGRIAFTAA
jgi:hypothetical protein